MITPQKPKGTMEDMDAENDKCDKSLTPEVEWVSQSVTPDAALHTVEPSLSNVVVLNIFMKIMKIVPINYIGYGKLEKFT